MGGNPLVGDPVNVATGEGRYDIDDVAIGSTLGQLRLTRSYTSDPRVWSFLNAQTDAGYYPVPFGATPTAEMSWWHNFFSFVQPSVQLYTVRLVTGEALTFTPCPALTSCFATPTTRSAEAQARLYRDLQADQFKIYIGDSRYIYATKLTSPGATRYFLTRIETGTYTDGGVGRTLAELTYSRSDTQCPNTAKGPLATPLIPTGINSVEGAQLRLAYTPIDGGTNKAGCALSAIYLGTDSTPLVSYSYSNGALSSATYSKRHSTDGQRELSEAYTYTSGFQVRRDGVLVHQQQTSGAGLVTMLSNSVAGSSADEVRVDRIPGARPCPTDQWCQSSLTPTAQFTTFPGSTFSSTHTVTLSVPSFASASRVAAWSMLSNDGSGAAVSTWDWGTAPLTTRSSDTSGVTQTSEVATSSYAGGVTPPAQYETIATSIGSGSGPALERRGYSYTYGSGGNPRSFDQLLERESSPSTLGDTGDAGVFYAYDTLNNIQRAIRHGQTKVMQGGSVSVVTRYIGTFYQYADPFSRLTESDGPCFVENEQATQCTGLYPKMRYEYFGTDTSLDSRRLKAVVQESSDGTNSLRLAYSNYDSYGNPGRIVRPDGVEELYTYDENRVTSRTVGQTVTTFVYDMGYLYAARTGSGPYEIFCHRVGNITPATGCPSTGALSKELTARIRGTMSLDGKNYDSAIIYTYDLDGLVLSEVAQDSTGSTRRVVTRARSARGVTAAKVGNAPPVLSWYDGDRRLTALRLPLSDSANEPQNCGPVPDPRCAQYAYDQAGRLSSFAEPSAQFSNMPQAITRFLYDVQGNLNDTVSDCSPAGQCSQRHALYTWDDFGNIVETNVLGLGVTRFEFDASGNPLKKQTPELRKSGAWLAWEYDPLGHLTREHLVGSARDTELYAKRWTTAPQMPAGCTAISRGASIIGRLAYESDPVWNTWYGYDEMGRLTEKQQVRSGATTCTRASAVRTTFSYDQAGRLSSVRYPFGLMVQLDTSATTGRLSAIRLSRNGSPLEWAIQNIRWEPDEALRSYDVVNTLTARRKTVDYRRDSSPETTPVGGSNGLCSGIPVSPTEASDDRLRLLLVSDPSSPQDVPVLRKWYTWRAGNVAQTDVCYESPSAPTCTLRFPDAGCASWNNPSPPIRESFGYDVAGRVASATGPWGGYNFAYDTRGNRTFVGLPSVGQDVGFRQTYDAGAPDLMLSYQSSLPNSGIVVQSTWTSDGQLASRTAGGRVTRFDYGFPAEGGLESVFGAVTLPSGTYNYFYDSNKRRTQKHLPTNLTQEYFWAGADLLTDKGAALPAECTYYDWEDDICYEWSSPNRVPITDYVWLAGRPVMALDSTVDLDAQNSANDVAGGVHHLIVDQLGRPVVALDSNFMISGVGEYEPFGAINVARGLSNTPVPYQYTYCTACDENGCDPDFPFGCRCLQCASTAQATGYYPATPPQVQSDPHIGPGNFLGASSVDEMNVLHYQRAETSIWFPPFRGAGMYADSETGLYQNWNRYYDPDTGRYLSPEPMVQSPNFVAGQAMYGLSTPTYAYANDNPLKYVDRNGLWPSFPNPLPIVLGPPTFPVVPSGSFPTPVDAAGNALVGCYPWTEQTKEEVGGRICRDPKTGANSIAGPLRGGGGHVWADSVPCPPGLIPNGSWHTHDPSGLEPNNAYAPFSPEDRSWAHDFDYGYFVGQRTPDMAPGDFGFWGYLPGINSRIRYPHP